jgi:hypothetical protein
MSIQDLEFILKKDPVIATFPVTDLRDKPEQVEQFYTTHAKTHLSLGDTAKHVDTIFKWVSGVNKGAFIGAVVGNYGEGKTSFLVHVWHESIRRRVFAVPPFEWVRFGEILDAVAAWTQYILGQTHPNQAKKAQRVYEEFKEKDLDETAKVIAKNTGQDIDDIRTMLVAAVNQGGKLLMEVSPAGFLDYCDRLTEIVKEAGFSGVLVLLDEPEVAAKQLGREKVAHLLFDLSNELHRREGDYGVFVSLPQNFLADIQRRFSALPARLQARQCFPRLGDIYGPDFAVNLWNRYVERFELGNEGRNVVSPATLQAIGQVGSSERVDLSYGPRTVVSAFNRMVYRYRQDHDTYQPEEFVQDCLEGEIMVNPDYPARVREVLNSPQIDAAHRDALMFLAAFPNGAPMEAVKSKGLDGVFNSLSRRGIMVYKTAFCYGLSKLKKIGTGEEFDPFSDAILSIAGEFAPNQDTFDASQDAFANHFLPQVFPQRQGQQLLGWEYKENWSVDSHGTRRALLVGSFAQTEKQFPHKAITVAISSVDVPIENVCAHDVTECEASLLAVDAIVHFRLRWHSDQAKPSQRIEILSGEESTGKPAEIRIVVELEESTVTNDRLEELVGEESLMALWVLNLLRRMDDIMLPQASQAQWQALQDQLVRGLVSQFLDDGLRSQASEVIRQNVSGSGLDLIGSILQKLFRARYPSYSTLVRQPQWEQKVDDYLRALQSERIPLACKRGAEPWTVDGDDAAKVLGTSRMNLTGGAFESFDNLITISTKGRNAPIEVRFRMHPLEQEIVGEIMKERTGGGRKLKIDGKDCWWIPLRDLMPLIRQSGYNVDEMKKIVEIGKARGSFGVHERKGEEVLYCKPIDLEQMKRQLREKLSDLDAEIAEFKKLSGFISTFDSKSTAERINALKDEDEYDRLVTEIHKVFEQNHQRLPGYFDRLEERFRAVREKFTKNVTEPILDSREVSTVKTIPSGKSKWCADLGKFIVPNLKRAVDDLKSKVAALSQEVGTCIARFKFIGPANPLGSLQLLQEGYQAALDAETQQEMIISLGKMLFTQLRDYDGWRNVLRQSDEVYENLLEMASEPASKAMANTLLSEHDTISRDISEHLSTRNLQGLASYRQFESRLNEVGEKRRKYLVQLKGDFDKRKDIVNNVLQSLHIDRRVTITFNPLEGEGSYVQMYEQAASHVIEALSQQLQDVETQERELKYAKDVLDIADDKRVSSVLTSLSSGRTELAETSKSVNKEWIRAIAEDSSESHMKVDNSMKRVFEVIREARKFAGSLAGTRAKIDGRAKQMYDLIPERGSADLKGVILQMMADRPPNPKVLDESLECLGELFRKNWAQIKVERRNS